MRSQGIVLNDVEERPPLPEAPKRASSATATSRITPRVPSDKMKMRRSIEYGGKVLT